LRTAVELATASGIVRGVAFKGAGLGTVIFVHDLQRDLDEFGSLPELLAASGFDTVAVDLPGHGLSEGDEIAPERCPAVVTEIVAEVAARDRADVVGLVSAGRTATVGAALGREARVAAQVLANPRFDAGIAAPAPRVHAVRMVVHGDGPSLVGTDTQRFFSYLIGEKLLLFNAGIASGVAAIAESPTLHAHVELFFKRYLH
jgi:pimeloyl-ACP methyl ester carboxylesterase